MDVLDNINKVCGKEIREEEINIEQILLTFFSAWTNNPQNTRILSPSGEGKTYLVTKVAKLFPEENIIILAKATPQSFKYALSSKKIILDMNGEYQDYDDVLASLEDSYKNTKDKVDRNEIKRQIKDLEKSVYDLVDFTNKVIVLVDSQSFELFESIKTTLSHDQHEIKSFSANKSKSGTILGQKFLFRGYPAVIYCSAKDEQKRDFTNEISTRFNTISLNASSTKYRKMLELEALRSSLPDSIFQEEVISDLEIKLLKEQIKEIIKDVQEYGRCCNPYGLGLQGLFREDAGFRTRQFKILNNNITIHTLVNSKQRLKILYDGIKTPISTRLDIEEACKLTKEPKEIQSYKIKYFNDHIRKAILESGKEITLLEGTVKCLTATEISDFITNKGTPTDRQKLQETFLRLLVDHGFLDEFEDPSNRSRHLYSLNPSYLEKEATIESALIDTSRLDFSCVDSFMTKFIQQRFDSESLKIVDENDQEITLQELLEILHKIDTDTTQNTNKTISVEGSINVEKLGEIN